MKEKLLKRLPKKYHFLIHEFEQEDGLIDNCKFMLYFVDGYAWDEFESVPCMSITEAIYFIKGASKIKR